MGWFKNLRNKMRLSKFIKLSGPILMGVQWNCPNIVNIVPSLEGDGDIIKITFEYHGGYTNCVTVAYKTIMHMIDPNECFPYPTCGKELVEFLIKRTTYMKNIDQPVQ